METMADEILCTGCDISHAVTFLQNIMDALGQVIAKDKINRSIKLSLEEIVSSIHEEQDKETMRAAVAGEARAITYTSKRTHKSSGARPKA